MSTNNVNCLVGWECPQCGGEDLFYVQASTLFTLTDDGTDLASAEVEWDETSYARCGECGKEGTVRTFTAKRTG